MAWQRPRRMRDRIARAGGAIASGVTGTVRFVMSFIGAMFGV